MNSEQREKYSRQILFPGIGETGQENLLRASAALVGCGALGTVVANLLVRAGVGRLRIIDRDF
ncbi:MAG: ThiF family adenylyltransferase, partial [Candidatus Acidiferrales bacterium]